LAINITPFTWILSKKNRQKNMQVKSLIMVAPRKVWAYISWLILVAINTEMVVINVSTVIKPNIIQKCGSIQAAWADLLNSNGGTAMTTASSRNDKTKV
jgi:hypothetical protein